MTCFGPVVLAAFALSVFSIPAHADDLADIDAARKFVAPMLGNTCVFTETADDDFGSLSHVYQLKFRYPGQGQDEPDNKLTLIQLFCSAGLYNASSIYITKQPQTGDFSLLSFAEPRVDYDYADESFAKLKAPPKVSGYVTRVELFNSEYHPETATISANAKWRGGDAWSSGSWEFIEGEFVLRKFSVDPTFKTNGSDSDNSAPKRTDSYQVYPEATRRID